MATMSITSNDGTLASASAVLEVSATNPPIINQHCISNRQARAAGPRQSESMTQIPTSSSSRVIKWLRQENMRSPSSRIRCRSMVALLAIQDLRRLLYFDA